MDGACGKSPPRVVLRPRSPFVLVVLVVCVALAWVLTSRPATAHAEPECTNPPVGAVLAAAPAVVEIWFSEEVDPALTQLTVVAADGSQIDRGDTTVDLNDLERKHVTVSLKPGLGPGSYDVRWHSVSGADQDVAEGSFTFTVAVPATPGPASPTPLASPIGPPTATPIACG